MLQHVKILYEGSALLRQASAMVPLPLSDSVFELIDTLKYAIRYKDSIWTDCGLSLSAPQIGVLSQVFIMSRPQHWESHRQRAFDTVINPIIISRSDTTEKDWEGCLSVPKYQYLVERPTSIDVRFVTYSGKCVERRLKGFYARIFQHEVDHLEGVLMTDRALDQRPIPN